MAGKLAFLEKNPKSHIPFPKQNKMNNEQKRHMPLETSISIILFGNNAGNNEEEKNLRIMLNLEKKNKYVRI